VLASAVLLTASALVVVAAVNWTPSCPALTARTVTPDPGLTGRFAAYGDGATTPTWTGGDGTHSVRLPDGRTLWLFDDTLLGPVLPPDAAHLGTWSPPGSPGVANSAVLQAPDGRLTRTITGGTTAPASWIPGEHASGQWNWPVTALVDRDHGRPVLRVLVHHTANGDQQYVFGVGRSTAVRTYTLPGLRLTGQATLPVPADDPGERVLYGTTALSDARYFYVYGNTTPADGRAAMYLARVPRGAVDQPGRWRYWDYGRWRRTPSAARPLPAVDDDTAPVSTGFGVVRQGRTYVLFSMRTDPRVHAGIVGEITSSWACTPAGPWHGAAHVYTPPETVNGGRTHTMIAYNPQAHPERTTPAGVSLSYDINDAAGVNGLANVKNDLSLYRPRFLRVRLGPPTYRAPGPSATRGSAPR
jgi:hypothetical protein